MAAKPEFLIVKTHRRAPENYPAISMQIDGGDSLVSYVRKKSEKTPEKYYDELKELITTSKSSTGTWGQNVLHWLNRDRENTVYVSYEELITNPERSVEQTLNKLNFDIPSQDKQASTFSFQDLNKVNNRFVAEVSLVVTRMKCPMTYMSFFGSNLNIDKQWSCLDINVKNASAFCYSLSR